MASAREPDAAHASQGGQRLALLVVCGIFITVGLLIFIPTFLLPLLDFFAMREWVETPCTILRGPAGEGAEREDVVVYAYTYEQVRCESSSLGLEGMLLPIRSTWELKPGFATVCYVNPWDHRKAVLWRDVDATILLGSAPLLFVFLPGIALIVGWRNIGRPAPPEPQTVPTGPAVPSLLLDPVHRSGGCGIFVILFFLFFLGGIIALLWFVGTAAHLVIGVPMALLWLLLLRSLGRALLSLLNPRVALRVTPGRGTPAGVLDVRWDVVGGLRSVRGFLLELVVREEHTYRSGKSSRTRTSPLATVQIARGGGKELRRGSTRITLPETMHSFRHGGASIVWAFRLTAEISFGPDIEEEFLFEVGAA